MQDTWRGIAVVVPILKPKKAKTRTRSFRPVTLLFPVSKTAEIKILERLKEHMEEEEVLSPEQFSFQWVHRVWFEGLIYKFIKLKMINSYLRERAFRSKSVPQGSDLGPIPYNILRFPNNESMPVAFLSSWRQGRYKIKYPITKNISGGEELTSTPGRGSSLWMKN